MALSQYSELMVEPDVDKILDFMFTLRSIPPWMSCYSSGNNGCLHRIQATAKAKDSQSSYEGFVRGLRSVIPNMLSKSLKKVLSKNFHFQSVLMIWTFSEKTTLSVSGMKDVLFRELNKMPKFSTSLTSI